MTTSSHLEWVVGNRIMLVHPGSYVRPLRGDARNRSNLQLLTPGLNWYRANMLPESLTAPPMQLPPVQAPTLGVWSTGDFALTEIQMTDSVRNVVGPWRYERLDGPGHGMQLESPDRVNALLLDYLPR